MTPDVPLLSICIPTFNRAELLEVCLATVLPQVAQFANEVECVVSDNASSDRTVVVLAESAKSFPIRVVRNAENIGIIANITKCVAELARGEFVLLMGDDVQRNQVGSIALAENHQNSFKDRKSTRLNSSHG